MPSFGCSYFYWLWQSPFCIGISAFRYLLFSEAIREAYFLGSRNDE
jgi:hypothetical protein